jgi:hypothetical protein
MTGSVSRSPSIRVGALFLAMIFGSLAASNSAKAVDQAKNVYLLGSRASLLSGVLPGPSNYFQNDLYFYNGEAGGGIQLPLGGFLASDVEAKIVALEIPTLMHVFNTPVLGGSLAVAGTLPIAPPGGFDGSPLYDEGIWARRKAP